MTSFDNAYSRLVSWAKIVLPMMALALLATLFLFSRTTGPGRGIPYSDAGIGELAREPRVTALNYSGVAKGGAAVSLTADIVGPDPDNGRMIRARGLAARIDAQSGLRVDVVADAGIFQDNGRRAILSGNAQAETSAGYRIRSDEFIANLDGVLLSSGVPVSVEGPFGALNAGNMTLDGADNGNGNYVLVFNGGVKLIYRPKAEGD